MPIYPIPFKVDSYKRGMGSFGALRANPPGRLHGACDLYAPPDTPVFACEDGVVRLNPYLFFDGSFAVEVTSGKRVFRYCEITPTLGIKAGEKIKAGDVIGRVKYLPSVKMSMLHFEIFSGKSDGPLTQSGAQGIIALPGGGLVPAARFGRRSDLINPTAYLDGCELRK